MKLSYTISALLFAISLFCFVKYTIIGSHLAADGTLVEPFYLIWFWFIAAFFSLFFAILGYVILWSKKISKPKK